jgi:Tol biopolymer transport system component
MDASPTLKPTITLEASTPLIPTATKFEGRLLFARFTEATHTFNGTYIARTDGSAEIEVPMPWTEGGGIWSKSGKEIAVATLLADGKVGTAIIETDGTVLRELSIPDPTLNLPCVFWSPDDTRLACEGWDETDPSRNGVYTVLAADGGDIQRLTTPPAGQQDFPGDYSSAGQFIFMRSSGYEVPGTLMIVDANGGEPRIFYNGRVNEAGRFSPDGRFVVTSSYGSLLAIGMDGNVLHRISIDGHIAFGPVWSPDGTRIAFSMTTPGVYSADIYTSLPDGTDMQKVTNTPYNEIRVEWGVGDE